MLTNENLNTKNQVKAFANDIMQTATTASMVTPYIVINRDKVLRSNESFLRLPEQIVGANCRWNGLSI